MKNKQKILFIIGMIFVLLFAAILFFIICNKDKNNSLNNENMEDKIVAPANSIEELKKITNVIEVVKINKDEIVFDEDTEINEKIGLWIYSQPKFLGYFDILVEKGAKKIVGLKHALEKITIEVGKHVIAITTMSGKPFGYVDVCLDSNNILTECITEDNVTEDKIEENNKINNIISNNSSQNNTNFNGSSNNMENNTNSNGTSNNVENNANSNATSNNTENIINSTIIYSCGTAFDDYKLENDKCKRTEIMKGVSVTSTCPNGYIYRSNKCYIEKEVTEIRYCDNNDYILDGHLCLDGRVIEVTPTILFYKPKEDSTSTSGTSYKFIRDLGEHVEFADIKCYSNHSKVTDSNSQTSYCQNLNGERVKPQSVTCKKNNLKLINNDNIYQCVGTKYEYYVCPGKLVGTKCYTGKRVNYGMYCEDGSSGINGKCLTETDVKPTVMPDCPGNFKPIPNTNTCGYEWVIDAIKTYNCPSGYILTDDYKCKQV